MGSKSLAGEGPARPHLVRGSGGLSGEISDLRGDIDRAIERLESHVGMPRLSRLSAVSLSLAAVPLNLVLTGQDLLAGQTFDTVVTGSGNSQLTWTARRPGDSGLLVEIVDSGVGGLAVSLDGQRIEIDLGGAASTAAQIVTAVQADGTLNALVNVVAGGTGAVSPDVTGEVALAGGVGKGLKLWIAGIEQALITQPTETSITVRVTALTGAANGERASVVVEADGVRSGPMTIDIVT